MTFWTFLSTGIVSRDSRRSVGGRMFGLMTKSFHPGSKNRKSTIGLNHISLFIPGSFLYAPYRKAVSRDSRHTSKSGKDFDGAIKTFFSSLLIHLIIRGCKLDR